MRLQTVAKKKMEDPPSRHQSVLLILSHIQTGTLRNHQPYDYHFSILTRMVSVIYSELIDLRVCVCCMVTGTTMPSIIIESHPHCFWMRTHTHSLATRTRRNSNAIPHIHLFK